MTTSSNVKHSFDTQQSPWKAKIMNSIFNVKKLAELYETSLFDIFDGNVHENFNWKSF